MNAPLAAANNEFAFRLAAQLFRAAPGKNVFFSPYSVHAALCMTMNGARRETLQAMCLALCLEQLSRDKINQAYATQRNQIEQHGEAVQIAIANAVWVDAKEELLPEFQQRCVEFYAARAASLDFSSYQALDEINAWVAEQTRQKITDLLRPRDLKPPPSVALVNAIYFKGLWRAPFDIQKTSQRAFTLANGATKPMPMMALTDSYAYLETPEFQAVSLPYGKGEASLLIFLPARDLTLAEFLAGITPQNWAGWISQMRETRLTLALPRFKLECEAELSRPLAACGMQIAFQPGADFGAMCRRPVFISKVRHKAFLEVNEEGSQAAAATAVLTLRAALRAGAQMVVDRPFFCAIRHNPGGALLFTGAVYDPQV